MIAFIVRRIAIMIPMALSISAIIFFASRLSPIDPLNSLISPDAAADPTNLAILRERLGFNDPIIVQYFNWLIEMFKGNFGYSIQSGQPISEILALRMPATLELVLAALIISTTLALLIGLIAGANRGGLTDKASRALAAVGISVPDFFIGLALLNVLAYRLNWLPTGQRISPGQETFFARLPHLILPVVTLSIAMLAVLIRYTRNSVLDTLNRDFVNGS